MTAGGSSIREMQALLRVLAAGRDVVEQLRGRGPFGLLFYDAGPPYDVDLAFALLEPGGLLVKDDLTPGYDAPDVWRDLLRDPRFAAAEILTTPEAAAIVAVRCISAGV